jgi:MYXO-CTERM domain-containing protein
MINKLTALLCLALVLLSMSNQVMAHGTSLPDGGSSGLLLGIAAVGLAFTRRFMRKP